MPGPEGERPQGELTSQQVKPTEQHKPNLEAGNAAPGLSPTLNERSKPPPTRQERQPLPGVWDYLERRVRLNERHAEHRIGEEEYDHKRRGLNQLGNALYKSATDRDRLLLKLYTEKGFEPASPPAPDRLKELSPEEFQQFRSKIEPMSEEEIDEELLKQEEENYRKIDEARRSGKISPPQTLVFGQPHISDDLFDNIGADLDEQ